jgi:YVTN family beta-propeller protein
MDFTFFRDAAGPFGPSGVVCFPDAVVQGALEVSQSNADPTASTTKYEFSGFTKNGKQASYSLTLEGVIDDPARWLPAGSEAATITGGSWRMKAKGGNVCSGEGTLAFVITIAGGFQVFVANGGPNTASVIATAGNSVVSTVGAGNQPRGAAVSPLGDVAYIANDASDDVTVIDAENHSVLTTIPVGQFPVSVAFTPDGSHAYVTNRDDNTVSVIETAGRTVVKTIGVGTHPLGAAVTPNGAFAYVANNISGNVSVISTETNTVVQTIPVGGYLFGIAIGTTANGVYAYVAIRARTLSWAQSPSVIFQRT